MFRYTLALFVSILLSFHVPFEAQAQSDPPNVIVLFTDDQGTLDTGAYGATDLQTPAMDKLSETGVSFTQFYAASPVCSPSRAALLTGRDPNRTGLGANAPSQPGPGGLPAEEITMAEIFRDAGYATAHIGKWHLGYSSGQLPNDQGFDYSFGHMGGVIDNYSHFYYWGGPNQHDLWRNGERVYHDGEYFPDLMVQEATEFMEENREEPFFLYYAINMPHYPYQGDVEWLEYYQDQGLPYPRDLYAAFLSTMDERIGQIIRALEELGLREETLIVFQADHGHSTEARAHYGGGYAGEYRGAKFSLFEGGIRIPAMVSMPGTVPQGEWRDQMAHGTDWLPTIASFAGIELPDRRLDGKNLREVILSDASSPHEELFWKFREQWAVRKGEWKLIGNPWDTTERGDAPRGDGRFLANMRLDPTEQTDYRESHPEIEAELEQLYEEWLEGLEVESE
ncbi:MAG: sulfatase-like hydrolase/transferase [Bacteroidota bacterium]